MSYISLEQLQDRYGEKTLIQLTDRVTPAAGIMDTDVIARALADADATIDAYLAARYALPFSTVPALLIDLAGAIAIYKLHAKQAPEKIRTDYEDALRRLSDIAKGVMRLDAAGVEPAGSSLGQVRTNEPERPFTTTTLKGFI